MANRKKRVAAFRAHLDAWRKPTTSATAGLAAHPAAAYLVLARAVDPESVRDLRQMPADERVALVDQALRAVPGVMATLDVSIVTAVTADAWTHVVALAVELGHVLRSAAALSREDARDRRQSLVINERMPGCLDSITDMCVAAGGGAQLAAAVRRWEAAWAT